jgi:hypothetical protein
MPDLTFHSLVLHRWSACASEGGSWETPEAFLTELGGYLTPHASLLISGVVEGAPAAGWARALEGWGELTSVGVEGGEGLCVLACDCVGPRSARPRLLLVVSEDAGAAARLKGLLEEGSKGQGQAKGQDVAVELVPAQAQGGPGLEGPQAQGAWDGVVGRALARAEAQGRVLSVVFVPLAEEATLLGAQEFVRLASLARALAAQEGAIRARHPGCAVWVLTEGAYHGPVIRPHMGTLQGFSNPLNIEHRFVHFKLVDMASQAQALPLAADLVLRDPKEKLYLVRGWACHPCTLAHMKTRACMALTAQHDVPEHCCSITHGEGSLGSMTHPSINHTTPSHQVGGEEQAGPRVLRYTPIDMGARLSQPIKADDPVKAFEAVVPYDFATPGQVCACACGSGEEGGGRDCGWPYVGELEWGLTPSLIDSLIENLKPP